MTLTLSTGDWKPQSDVPAGKYHFAVVKVATDDRGDNLILTLEVLASDVDGIEVGSTKNEYFSLSLKALPRIINLAIACGIYTIEQVETMKTAGQDIDLDENEFQNRQFLGLLEDQEYNGKKSTKLGYSTFWSLDNPAKRNWPRNEKMANQAGRPSSASNAGGLANGVF